MIGNIFKPGSLIEREEMKTAIRKVHARQILDSRGNPTLEVKACSESGCATAMVPSGASTGKHEALELRDNSQQYHGKGVAKAAENVNTAIADAVTGMDASCQEAVDRRMIELDSTINKSRLGANAILGVSMACCRLAAIEKNIELYEHIMSIFGTERLVLPVPLMNLINGGRHAGNSLDIQEYLVLPVGADSFSGAVRMCSEIYQSLKALISDRYGSLATNVGDEGGFAPNIRGNEEPLGILCEAIRQSGYSGRVKLGLDCAASEFFRNTDLRYLFGDGNFSGEELMRIYMGYLEKYPIISIEDPFSQDDFETFSKIKCMAGDKIQLIGDDLLCTNASRIRMAAERNACNSLLLKLNQIGTVTEALEAARLAMGNGWSVVVSHRSGETPDDFIADLAVGIGCGQIKAGAPCRGERVAKYNRLMQIEDMLIRKGAQFSYGTGIIMKR